MNYFSIKLSMDAGISQPEIIQLVKSNGGDSIQTSDGLCVKTDSSEDKLKELFKNKTGLTIAPVDKSDASLPKDVQVFMER